jgi:hypothetical protein
MFPHLGHWIETKKAIEDFRGKDALTFLRPRHESRPKTWGKNWRDSLRPRNRWRPEIWRRNSHEHEIWVPVRPAERLLLGFKKSVNNKGVSFELCPARAPRCFAADHGGAGVDRQQRAIGKRYFAAVRNPARIDGTMSRPQSRAGGTDVAPRPTIGTATPAGPINRDSCEQ